MKYTKDRPEFKKFRVYMSSGNSIPIDEDEVDKVMLGINMGQPVKLRQGIMNPSFFISIGIDVERYENWKNSIDRQGFGNERETWYPVLENLPDIFQGVLDSPKEKQLNP